MGECDSYNSRSEPGSFFAGGKKAYLDRIEWLEIPDEETKIAGIETGEWDIVDYAGLDFFQRLDSNPDIGVMISTPGNQSSITMQSNVFPTDNKLVRQAIGAAINAEDHMASLGDPALWMLCPAVFFCGTPLESDVSAEFYNENNPERAKELLAQAGYNGEPIVIMNPTDYPDYSTNFNTVDNYLLSIINSLNTNNGDDNQIWVPGVNCIGPGSAGIITVGSSNSTMPVCPQ